MVRLKNPYAQNKPNFFRKLWNTFKSLDKFTQYTVITMILIIIATPTVVTTYLTLSQHASSLTNGDLTNESIDLMVSSADSLVNSDPLANIDKNAPYSSLPYDLSALIGASKIMQDLNPAKSMIYKTYAISIADYLVAHKDDNNDGKVGWGLPYAWDAFSDGTQNPANTVYAFQDGLVGNALFDAYSYTGNSQYAQVAQQSVLDYLDSSTISINSQCSNCMYFWYSANKNDIGRLVKNTNMLMGMNLARLASLTNNSSYFTLANKIYNSEIYEINTRNNFSYFGYDDPKYKNTLDAHIALETWAFTNLSAYIGKTNYIPTALSLKNTFWNCGNTCDADISTIYGKFLSCAMVPIDESSVDRCSAVVSFANSSNSVLTTFPLLGLEIAIPVFEKNYPPTSPTPYPTISPTPTGSQTSVTPSQNPTEAPTTTEVISIQPTEEPTATPVLTPTNHNTQPQKIYEPVPNGYHDNTNPVIPTVVLITQPPIEPNTFYSALIKPLLGLNNFIATIFRNIFTNAVSNK